jgi:hypothetical protein
MLAAYAVEARKLLHIIADTERHRIKVSSDRLLPRTLKLFTVEHWGNYHRAATELNFALSSDASVFGTLLGLLPTPAASGVGLYTKPAATIADGTLDLSALTSRYDCNRNELLTLDLDQLGEMESELREELAVWLEKPNGDASEATTLKRGRLALTQLSHRRELHNKRHGGGGRDGGGGDKRGGRSGRGDGRGSLPPKNDNKSGGGLERRNGNGRRDGNGGGGGGGGDDSDSSSGSGDTDSEEGSEFERNRRRGFSGDEDRLRRKKRKLRRAKRRRRHERERVAQLQRDEEMELLKEQIKWQRSEMLQIAKAQSKSSGQLSKRIHGLNVEEGMLPRGFFEDDMDQFSRRCGLQAKKDNAVDPDEVERAWVASYLGAKPGDPVGDFVSDPTTATRCKATGQAARRRRPW